MLARIGSILDRASPTTFARCCVTCSHRQEVVPHHCIHHDPRIHGLELDELPATEQAVACPIPAGGCTIHHNRTMHYAGGNRSDEPRRAYILGFGTPPKKRAAPPRDFYWNRQKITLAAQRARAAADAAAKA